VRHRTAPNPKEEGTAVSPVPSDAPTQQAREVARLRAAFRDLHGARLYGFALLVSLGDRSQAASATVTTLLEGEERADVLRHPERAAAWLRAGALRRLRRSSAGPRPRAVERRTALEQLGAGEMSFAGLAAISLDDRAALVASTVEGFEGIDLEMILRTSPSETPRRATRARSRFLAAVGASRGRPLAARAEGLGSIGTRVRDAAQRAMGRQEPQT
jgi:hypothetical protein